MSIRSDHRTILANLVNSVTVDGANLYCTPYYINTPPEGQDYPYFFITAGGLTPNKSEFSVMSNFLNYNRIYKYMITCVFISPENDSESVEKQIDDIEEAILNKLQSASARNSGVYQDLVVSDISPIFNPDPEISDNMMMKTIEVSIEQVVNNPS